MAERTKVPRVDVSTLVSPDLLKAPVRPGWHRRWVTTSEEDVEQYREMGYVEVKDKDGEPVTRRELVLMEIPQDQWDANQAALVAHVKQRRANLRRTAAADTDQIAGQGEFRGKSATIGTVEVEERPINE